MKKDRGRPEETCTSPPPHTRATTRMMASSSDEEDYFEVESRAGEMENDQDEEARTPVGESGAAELHIQSPNGSSLEQRQTHAQQFTERPRSRSTDSRGGYYRHSLPTSIPAVPAIPAHLLVTGTPATLIQRRKGGDTARRASPNALSATPSPTLHIQRPSTSGEARLNTPTQRSPNPLSPRSQHEIAAKHAPPSARRKSLSALIGRSHRSTLDKLESRSQAGARGGMHRFGKGRKEDLFLELANDEASAEERPPSRSERASSRLSFAQKRRSLPPQASWSSPGELRPRTSGAIFGERPASRLGSQGSDLHRHVERYRNVPSRNSFVADDAASVSVRSRSGLPLRYAERTTVSPPQVEEEPRSPELPSFGRRRPSVTATLPGHRARVSNASTKYQDAHSEAPADDSDPKHSLPESSAESEADDTVWDELDDLKSRIKKLEHTGKAPPTFGHTHSNESSDRPRTATTAPTTIGSSPKHAKQEKHPQIEPAANIDPEEEPLENAATGPTLSTIHPNLHAALAKAKSLLNGPLYRTLEATATDALQLAAMTGSAGPQGTTYTAAAIINGVTVSDRFVRRKADTMCRNLTDLCLALCEGKTEAPTMISSPVTLGTPHQQSPSIRLPRNSLDPNAGLTSRAGVGRPMSRLEARRTSILGSQAGSSFGTSPGLSGGEDMSASEQESTPSNIRNTSLRRLERSSSRLQTSRLQQRYDEAADDEDPTIRPASRAMTDFGRPKPLGPRDYGNSNTPQRSPSLRDALVSRRVSANAAAHEGNRDLMRVASLGSEAGSRRRFHDPATPPVLEEEAGDEGYQVSNSGISSHSKRRIMSFGNFGSRRTVGEGPSRSGSLNHRRHIVVE